MSERIERLEWTVRPEPSRSGSSAQAPSRLPDRERARLQKALGRSVLALAPAELRRLERVLTSPQRALVAEAVRSVRSVVLEREPER